MRVADWWSDLVYSDVSEGNLLSGIASVLVSCACYSGYVVTCEWAEDVGCTATYGSGCPSMMSGMSVSTLLSSGSSGIATGSTNTPSVTT